MAVKQLAVLGSTGSIGVTTLDLVARFPDRFRAVALAAGRNVERLAEQVRRFQPQLVATADAAGAAALRAAVPDFRGEILAGIDGIEQVATAPERRPGDLGAGRRARPAADAGAPSRRARTSRWRTRKCWSSPASWCRRRRARAGVNVFPLDSEHNAIYQAMHGHRRERRAAHHPHRLGRAVPAHAAWTSCARVDAGAGAQAPDLEDGQQDHHRLLDADEQGARGDRGALAVRPAARPDRRRHPSAEHRPFDGRVRRRLGAGAARHPRHGDPDLLHPRLSGAPAAHASAVARPGRRPGGSSSSRPTSSAFPCLALAYQALRACGTRAGRAQRRQRGAGRRLPERAPSAISTSRGIAARCSTATTVIALADRSTTSSRPTPGPARTAARCSTRRCRVRRRPPSEATVYRWQNGFTDDC